MKKKKGRGGDIYDRIRKRGDFGLWLDWCMNNEDYEFGRIGLNEIRKRINEYVKDGKINEAMELNQGLYRDYLKWLAPRYFDEYMIYLEIDRPPAERFYAPRRQILKQITDVLQDLVDDKLDEVFLHCPPRVGKTTIMLFFLTWLAGRSPELSNLYSAYSSGITGAMYNGVMEIVNDPVTYKWAEIFPGVDIVKKDGLETTIDFGRKKRYPTITCRSVHGTLNGQCDARGVLISDDLIEGIEEANNKDRLAKAWQIVDNNLITRAKERCKIVWMGTRWSLFDPPGVRLDLLDGNEKYKSRRYKVINLPALDENGNSNFDYKKPCEEGFSTEYYEQRRASFEQNNDMASWSAQYMQEPIEREGALFTPETMRYYNGVLPEGKPDRVFGAVDVAFGGGDYVAMPVAYQFGDDVYIADVVFSDSDKSVTEPMVAEKVVKHRMTALEIEANAGGDAYKEDVEQLLKDAGYRLNIMSKRANNQKAKEIRILDKAPEIREFYFLDRNKRSVEYQNFMQQLFSFTVYGKNKHDDAPDSLSQLCEMIRGSSPIIKILEKRLW